ncbi:hypothetical protein P9112_006597 [Eukaryota sp. TZLM1-RC]
MNDLVSASTRLAEHHIGNFDTEDNTNPITPEPIDQDLIDRALVLLQRSLRHTDGTSRAHYSSSNCSSNDLLSCTIQSMFPLNPSLSPVEAARALEDSLSRANSTVSTRDASTNTATVLPTPRGDVPFNVVPLVSARRCPR